jgi:hypothetical protein
VPHRPPTSARPGSMSWRARRRRRRPRPSASAQDDAEAPARRLITIDSSGGTQSGNLRFGPIRYEHPDPEGVVATVSTLTIRGPAPS